jgi:NAD(P)-dependent dehydrogenase (short-subunit alcohol dehydrogenase family)
MRGSRLEMRAILRRARPEGRDLNQSCVNRPRWRLTQVSITCKRPIHARCKASKGGSVMGRLDGKSALVTGGAVGIGAACARRRQHHQPVADLRPGRRARRAVLPRSKGAMRLMSKTDALLYAADGIRVNSIHPGFIRTPMVEQHVASMGGDAQQHRREVAALHPLGHMGEADDIAWGVVYLASDEARFITGSELVIDGGYTCR